MKKLVLGTGNPNANVMIIGESPGTNEVKTGKPFVGRSGKLLDEWLTILNLKRDQIYITNLVKTKHPKGGIKLSDISENLPYLLREINSVDPNVIILLGRFAMEAILDTKSNISDMAGSIMETAVMGRKRTVIVLYHPAYFLRGHMDLEKEMREKLQYLGEIMS